MYQGSMRDITNPSQYTQFKVLSNITNLHADNKALNATSPIYRFRTIQSRNKILTMRELGAAESLEPNST
jgi:hypothetical protein